jgi:hypothetical protein
VRSGDTLSAIALRELGNANRWTEIKKVDGSTFTAAEAQLIKPGQSIYLPVSYQRGPGVSVTPKPSSTPIANSQVYVYPESFVGPVPLGSIRVKSDHHLILAGVKRLYEDKKRYGANFPVDYYDQICRYLFQLALNKNGGNKLKAFEDLRDISDGKFGWDFQNHYTKLVGTDKKNGWDKVKHFAHSAYHRYTKGHPAAAIITRAKEFNDLVESWFGQDPEGWSDDDMVANYKGINFAAEHG